jgi:MYXO-CTERM domain-containing protein
MRRRSSCFVFVTSIAITLATTVAARDAHACGGCFHVSQSRSPTQVTSHRMALSISTEQTTLWDQIQYVGEPEEFAWVLPIRGQVTIGLSSDLLFSQLDALTAVRIQSPSVSCPGSGGSGDPCGFGTTSTKASGGGGSKQQAEGGPVEVIAQEVVGPFETVQLSSDDPLALRAWLDSHGYEIPTDIEPVIGAYVREDFDFLALRLLPGASVDSMRPIRITTPGASPSLPLRMVAAGTGASTAISLFIVAEGSYVPSNLPWGTISEADLIWDFDAKRSNYSELRKAYFESYPTGAWLNEAAFEIGAWQFEDVLTTAAISPASSGYGGAAGAGAEAEAEADLGALFAGLDPASIVLTRLNAELTREGLATDLSLEASTMTVPTAFFVSEYSGNPCVSAGFACGDPDDGIIDGDDDGDSSTAGCNCGSTAPVGAPAAAILLGLAVAARLRRRRR